jgi:hypothetical protein
MIYLSLYGTGRAERSDAGARLLELNYLAVIARSYLSRAPPRALAEASVQGSRRGSFFSAMGSQDTNCGIHLFICQLASLIIGTIQYTHVFLGAELAPAATFAHFHHSLI